MSSTRAIASRQETGSATSSTTVRNPSPRTAAAATRTSAFSWVRALPITSQPEPANRNAVAAPMPPVAPVTTTLRPAQRSAEVSVKAITPAFRS
jgi:hypothetical protein